MIRIQRYGDEAAWLAAILDDFRIALSGTRAAGTRMVLALAGGSTPEPAYRALAEELASGISTRVPALLVVGDERDLERGSGNRNETMIRQAFAPALDSGSATLAAWEPGEHAIASMAGFLSLLARDRTAGKPVAPGQAASVDLFDVCYLGLGADGHTAGLFPGDRAIDDPAPVVRGKAPEYPFDRLSLGLAVLRSAARTRFIVKSAGKESALERLGHGDRTCPAVLASSGDSIAFVLE